MKNKNRTITLLLCNLLPIGLHGMKPSSKIFNKPLKPTSTTPIIRQPQPRIEFPTPEPKTQQPQGKPNTTTSSEKSSNLPINITQPSKIPSFTKASGDKSDLTKYPELFEPTKQRQTFISPKDRIEHYKTLVNDAQKQGLKVKKHNSLIKQIEQAEDFTETAAINIAEFFNELQAKIELKELTINLDNLITTAKKLDISRQDLEKFKKLDINSANDMLTIDIFKEKTDEQIAELENLIEKQKSHQKLEQIQKGAEQKATEEQAQREADKLQKEVDQLYKEIEKEFDAAQQAEQERITAEAKIKAIEQEQQKAAANQKEQQKLLKEITESEVTLEQIERAKQERDKAIEQLKKEWEDKKTALDAQTQKEMEAHTTQQEIEATRRKEALKEIKTEKLRAQSKARRAEQKAQKEQQKLEQAIIKLQQAETNLQIKENNITQDAQEIKQLETELAELKRKHQSVLQEMAEVKSNFAEQQEKIKTQAKSEKDQLTQDTATRIQEAKDNLQKSQDFIAKNSQQQSIELDALEKQYNEEAAIKQQEIEKTKYEQLQQRDKIYEQELRLIETELEQFLKQQEINNQRQAQETIEAERAKTEEKERQKKEKEEREKREKENREREVEGHGDGNMAHNAPKESSQDTNTQAIPQKNNGNNKPNVPMTPQLQEIPMSQEKEEIQAITLPHITPEIAPTQQEKESQPIFIEPAIEQPAYPILEQPMPYSAGRLTNTAPRSWPPSKFSSYSPPTAIPPFMPSISSGISNPSTAESTGWNTTDLINPYTQRIEWQKNFEPKADTTAADIERDKKAQAQDIVWWEKILPKWVVQYLGRKDRTIKETQSPEEPTPISSPEEQKTEKPKPGIVKNLIESIKKPISNTINFIRRLFYD